MTKAKAKAASAADYFALAGYVLLIAGTAFISRPAALLVAGVICLRIGRAAA